MKSAVYSCLLAVTLLGCGTRKQSRTQNPKLTLTFADSIPGFSFTRSTKGMAFPQLHFLNQFHDTIEIYANGRKVDTFYKDHYHYQNGQPYIIRDEAPRVESRFVPLSGGKSTIQIRLKKEADSVSFPLDNEHDNYLVSWYNGHWYIVGLKSTVK